MSKQAETLPATAVVEYYVLNLLVLIGLQVTAFVAVFAGLFLVRKRSAAWVQDEDQSVRALGLVVKRPFSAGLLLTVLVEAIYHPNAPQGLVNAAWYLMLIPLLRLIPGIIAPKHKPALWLLAGLYTADGALAAVQKYQVWARLAALILAAAAAVALVWLDKQLRTRRAPGAWLNLGLGFVRVGIGALVVSFGCELIGATTLARFLESGVLRVLYGAVLLFASTLTLQGFMQVALRSGRLRSAMSVTESPDDLMRRFSSGLNYLGLAVFTLLVVSSFALLEPSTTLLSRLLTRRISVGAVQFSLGDAAVFVAVLVAASLLSRLLRFLLSIGIYSRIELRRGQSAAISKLLH